MADTITVEEFQEGARAWLAANRRHAPRDYGAICPPDLVDPAVAWHKRLVAAGYGGIHWPEQYGGRGLTPAHNAAWMFECASAGVPPIFNMVGLVLAAQALLKFGTDQQKAELLPPTLHADLLWCQLFSEPGAGSDLGGLSTKAVRDGDNWIVNGQKVWCSGGRYSQLGILMARTNPDAPKHAGISFFACDMRLPGIETRPLKQMTGEAEFDEVFFTDAALPADALLGPLNEGWNVGMAVLTNERGHVGTAVIGMERRLESMARLAEGRELTATQRQRLTSLITTGQAYKAMVQRQGPVASTAASLMKLGMSEMGFVQAELRSEVVGADGMLDGPETFGLLASPAGRIAGGTSQVQRNIIGERLLGLPREPKG